MILLLVACGGGTDGSAGDGPTRSAAGDAAASASPGAAGSPSPTVPTSSVDPADPGFPPAGDDAPTVARQEFTSPTGNIACQLDRTYAVCFIGEHDYPVTPRSDDCAEDWAPLFSVGRRGAATFGSCEGGVVAPGSALPYGTVSAVGPMSCLSRQTGMFCWNGRTGHGFRAARATYDLH